jgi:hypothetical protein
VKIRIADSLLVCVLAAALGACRPSELPIPLDVAATGPAPGAVPYVEGLRLYVEPAEDERPDKARVGANREEATAVAIVADPREPSAFVTRIVRTALRDSGVHLVRNADSANRVLRMRLRRFFTEETSTYHADVGVIAEVFDSDGHVLFSSMVSGTAHQWGLSLSPDNYDEVFSRAVFDMGKNLMLQADFQRALGAGGAGTAGGR